MDFHILDSFILWEKCRNDACALAKADRRPREKKKFYRHFSIVKYSYLPKDTIK